ncbi:peptide transporter family 2-like isoform X1 [Stegodyphus dumicola]|uniref:peptide transporter family 2-like isoform X1 n=1 Tax=Stegodyphus dumicola TaxID=202533 RepID=UPI0015A964B9|nr:peptide transporter family 2-like isoform X1 [Stegodyphus dumicola]
MTAEPGHSCKQQEEGTEKKKYPRAVFFIIGNEFCERFCYYGLRTILTIYLTQRLLYSGNHATVLFHLFAMLAYFSPVLGAIIADSWLGKFRTILYISILYLAGCIVLAAGSIPAALGDMRITSLIGLFIIALGTGGIKPCVSAFGGDQFAPDQTKEIQRFFSFFYIAINLGSVISTFLTPILREDVHCFGSRSCYPLAFGVPAFLMIVALVIFIVGKPLYVMHPPEGNIIVEVFKCICHALGRKMKSSEKKKEHWLDYAEDKFDKKLINNIKVILHVLLLFIPLPVFWALFDQQASRWTLQATRLNGEFYGYHIKPDQMQVINPFLIIIFVPLFEYCIYPLASKCNLLKKPLQRMAVGGILTAASFVIAGFLELKLEGLDPVFPAPGYTEMTIINNSPCSIKIDKVGNLTVDTRIEAFDNKIVGNIARNTLNDWEFVTENCTELSEPEFKKTFNSTSDIESMMITIYDRKLEVLKTNDTKIKAKSGKPRVRIFFNTKYNFSNHPNSSFMVKKEGKRYLIEIENSEFPTLGLTSYSEFAPGKYDIHTPLNATSHNEIPVGNIRVRSGGAYIISIYQNSPSDGNFSVGTITMIEENSMHIFLQIPQYVIMTAGEIMFSVTGLEFSYSQAPSSMKSVLQAAWQLTVAFGNLIVLVIAELSLFDKMSHELFMFAIMMFIDMIIFAIMAYFYKYVKRNNTEESETRPENGKSNKAYEEETDFNK